MSEMKLKPCPFCGGTPKLRRGGDSKQYFMYFCSQCYKTPVKYSEARLSERAAKRTWNRRVDDDKV